MNKKIRYDVYGSSQKWAASYDPELDKTMSNSAFDQAVMTAKHTGGVVMEVELGPKDEVIFAKHVFPKEA